MKKLLYWRLSDKVYDVYSRDLYGSVSYPVVDVYVDLTRAEVSWGVDVFFCEEIELTQEERHRIFEKRFETKEEAFAFADELLRPYYKLLSERLNNLI